MTTVIASSATGAQDRQTAPDITIAGPEADPRKGQSIDPLKLLLFPARAFLALGWIRAGVEKVIDPGWWSGAYVREFLVEQRDHMLPFAEPLVAMVTSYSIVLSFAVLVAEVIVGVCLLTGRRLRPALLVACALNIAFVSFGAVTPSAFYLVLQMTLLAAVALGRTVPEWRTWLTVGLCITAALLLAPMIATLHPAEVIEDPAIMLATLAVLVAATKALPLLAKGQNGSDAICPMR